MAASCMQCNIFSVHCDLFCDLWDCISFVIQLVGWRADNWSSGLVDHHYYYYARFYELWLTCDSRVIPGVENVAKTQKKLTQD